MELLSRARLEKLEGTVILITGSQDLEKAVDAMRIGAYDYLMKPLDIDQLDATMDRALFSTKVTPEFSVSLDESADEYVPGKIVGKSKAILELHKQIGLACRCFANVLILGETGVGKELVAKSIHHFSGYPGQFVAINCSAVVPTLMESELFGYEKGSFTGATSTKPGQLEAAKNGTIFLDEIGDLSLDLQVKLLRVLQEREFKRVGGSQSIPLQSRVITATHRNLEEMVDKGDFREDLYYRLKVLEIPIPPLRERLEDLPLLVKALLNKINLEVHRNVVHVTKDTMKMMENFEWYGNIRELENRLTAAVIQSPGNVLEMELPQSSSKKSGALNSKWQRTLLEVEKEHIQNVLEHVEGHFGRACEILGISRPTLRKKITDYDLKITFNED